MNLIRVESMYVTVQHSRVSVTSNRSQISSGTVSSFVDYLINCEVLTYYVYSDQ